MYSFRENTAPGVRVNKPPKWYNRLNTASLLSVAIALVIGASALIGWLNARIFTRSANPALVSSLTALFAFTSFGIFIYFTAKIIGNSIHAAEKVRREAERELIESEERFRASFEQAGVGIAHVAPDGRCLRINRKLCEILGYSPREILKLRLQEITHPDDLDSDAEQVREILDGEMQTYSMEKRFIRKDGLPVWTNLTASLVRGTMGEPKYFISVIKNISARKRAAEELMQSRQELENMLESISDGFFALDHNWRFTYLNKKATELLFRSRQELIGKNLWKELPQTVESAFHQQFRLAMGESQPVAFEEFYRPLNTWYAVHAYPYQYGLSVFFSDINERRKTEDALRNSEARLRESLREKEVLLRELHHRVKNNLQIISSLLHLQSESVRGKKITEMIRESQNRVKSMALIHEKLYQSEDLSHIDFGAYVRNLTGYLSRSYGINPDIIGFETEIEDVTISVDTAIPCGLIINELVTNSLKYAFPAGRRGSVLISVKASFNALTLVIADNGVGLPDSVDFGTVETLGLQLVQTLVGQLEGNIESIRGNGIAFTVTIPISTQSERNCEHGIDSENPDR